jgi:imidazole glycerol-phosphate synthase subunit HisF
LQELNEERKMNHRIIARLDIKGPNLVKGIHLEGLRVLGKPEHFAKFYCESGADELIFMDAVASLYERNSLHEIISLTAKEIFIPLTVGGGIRTIGDINAVLRAGADKVSINTAAIANPELIEECAREFGSSTIVVAIEAIRQPDGSYLAYTDNGRNHTGVDVFSWAEKVESLGAGEINLTSVDNEGTGNGFDCDLVKKVADSVSIPVVAHGGAGKLENISEVILEGEAHSVALSSMLHYDYICCNKDLIGYENEGNIEFLKTGKIFSKFETASVQKVKEYLKVNDVDCRPVLNESNRE